MTSFTWHPLYTSPLYSLTNGNLTVTRIGGASDNGLTLASFPASTNKWYFEVTVVFDTYSETVAIIGVEKYTGSISSNLGAASTSKAYRADGKKESGGAVTNYGEPMVSGDVIGVAVDLDTSSIWFSRNGVWQGGGDPVAGTNAAFTDVPIEIIPAFTTHGLVGAYGTANFGATAFTYTPPTGFNSWESILSSRILKVSDAITSYMANKEDAVTLEGLPKGKAGQSQPEPEPYNKDLEYQGLSYIEGVVRINGTPAIRRVRLVDRKNNFLVREVFSKSDGTYKFDRISSIPEYMILVLDQTRQHNAVVIDRVVAVEVGTVVDPTMFDDWVRVGVNLVAQPGDQFKVAGLLSVKGLFASRQVMLIDQQTYTIVGTTISDPITGGFEFIVDSGVKRYTVLALPSDSESDVNAQVLSHLAPVAV